MALVIRIDTTNDAFDQDFHGEIEKILDKVKGNLHNGLWSAPIHDSNGNTVGFYQYPTDNRLLTKIDQYWNEHTGVIQT